MDMEVEGDLEFLLDIEMLQLPEVSSFAMKSNPYVVEALFSQWLSLPETGRLSGASFNVGGNSTGINGVSNHSLPSMFPGGSTPPLSPRSASSSPRMVKQRFGPSSLSSPLKLVKEPAREAIPQFYFTSGRPAPNELTEDFLSKANQFFLSRSDGVQIKGEVEL